MSSPLRVCYFGTYRAGYTRNRVLIDGLRTQGVQVHECQATLWHGIADRVNAASGGWRNFRFLRRVVRTYAELCRAYRRAPAYDVMVIGYPGQIDVFLGRLLTWLRRKPLVLDVLMSLHLVAEERGLTKRSPFTARMIYILEWLGLRLPNRSIIENESYEEYLCRKYHLSSDRFDRVPHGADETGHVPQAPPPDTLPLRVVYYGTFLPSHGLDAVVEAARLFALDGTIEFHFFGEGPERDRIESCARELALTHCTFHGFVPTEALSNGIAQAHICLGVFGTTPQALMTVQNKIWETLAHRRPLISGDSPAVRASLTHGEHLFLVQRDDGRALADAIRQLQAQPVERERMAERGYAHFCTHNARGPLGAQLQAVLETLVR